MVQDQSSPQFIPIKLCQMIQICLLGPALAAGLPTLPEAGFLGTFRPDKVVEDSPMNIIPIGPGFAAEIRGVTLADVANDDAAYAAARAAFEEHSVLLFRGQEISGEGQLAFSARFGPPEVTKVGSLGTGTNFVILTTIGDDGKVVPEDHRFALRNKAKQLWHTDSSFKAVPALTSVLSARTIPDHGGETEFASTRLAFERPRSDVAAKTRKLVRLAPLRPFARQGRARARHDGRARRVAGAMLAHGVA